MLSLPAQLTRRWAVALDVILGLFKVGRSGNPAIVQMCSPVQHSFRSTHPHPVGVVHEQKGVAKAPTRLRAPSRDRSRDLIQTKHKLCF